MAPHSSTLPGKIPWMEEPGRLQSMGLQRVGHDWATSLWLFTFMHWRRKWQPTPVFLPVESQGWQSLVGCCLWGRRVGQDWSDLAAAAAAAASFPRPHSRVAVLLLEWVLQQMSLKLLIQCPFWNSDWIISMLFQAEHLSFNSYSSMVNSFRDSTAFQMLQ